MTEARAMSIDIFSIASEDDVHIVKIVEVK